jgi:hypothetical protein
VPDIGFRGWTQDGFANTASVTGTKPSGTVSTDVLFAFVYWDASTAPDVPAAPTGWTLINGGVNNGGLRGSLYWALGSAAAPVFHFSNGGTSTSCYNGLEIGGYVGADNTTPYTSNDYATAWGQNESGSDITTQPIQVQNGNWFVCGLVPYSVSNQTYGTPTGLTARSSSSPMAWFDSNGAAAGANVTATSSGSFSSGTFVGFALSLNPSGGGAGTPTATATLLGQNLDDSGASPTVTNSLAAIPSGAYLRLRASDTGYTGTAGHVTAVSGGGLTWAQLHDSADQANGNNHIRQSVWGATASSAIAEGALTVTATHTAGTDGSASIDLVMVTDSDGVDVSGYVDSATTSPNQSGGAAVTGAAAGDLLLGPFMGYATDSGGLGVGAGKLQTLIGTSSPPTTAPVQTWVALNGPTGTGTNEVEVNWGNTNGVGAPYVGWVEAFKPASGGSPQTGTPTVQTISVTSLSAKAAAGAVDVKPTIQAVSVTSPTPYVVPGAVHAAPSAQQIPVTSDSALIATGGRSVALTAQSVPVTSEAADAAPGGVVAEPSIQTVAVVSLDGEWVGSGAAQIASPSVQTIPVTSEAAGVVPGAVAVEPDIQTVPVTSLPGAWQAADAPQISRPSVQQVLVTSEAARAVPGAVAVDPSAQLVPVTSVAGAWHSGGAPQTASAAVQTVPVASLAALIARAASVRPVSGAVAIESLAYGHGAGPVVVGPQIGSVPVTSLPGGWNNGSLGTPVKGPTQAVAINTGNQAIPTSSGSNQAIPSNGGSNQAVPT